MWVEILQYNYKERLLNIGGYLQMATHFRNSYEVAGPEEMKSMLKFWSRQDDMPYRLII